MGNPAQINQIFMNLLTNAAFAMEEAGGILAVELTDVELDDSAPLVQSGLPPGYYLPITKKRGVYRHQAEKKLPSGDERILIC